MTVGSGHPDALYVADSAVLSDHALPRQRGVLDNGVSNAGVVSCVLDASPRFHMEALRWFAGLNRLAGVQPGDLRVGVVGDDRTDVADYLRSHGVAVRKVPAFDSRSPHCNKIAGALLLATDEPTGPCVLTDSDVAFLEDPRSLEMPGGHVAMKPVDAPNPPLDVLRTVFTAAGQPEPELVAVPAVEGATTFSGNGNGGLYVIPGELLSPLTQAWSYWASWLLERRELLDQWAVHVDQVAMALALASEGVPVHHLDPRWNVPTHAAEMLPRQVARPAMLHYHQAVDTIGQIAATGVPSIDEAIQQSNEATASVWQEAFPNATFWDWRYATNPDLGSGVGSRGQALRDKRELLTHVLDVISPTSVLDVGCGDGEATRGLPLPNYVGIDLSGEAVACASARRPDGTYHVGSLHQHPTAADLVFCLDVTIHLADPTVYHSLIAELLDSAGRALLIAGYESPSTSGSPMVYFHEPLSETILRHRPDAELYPIRYDHEVWTFLVLLPPAARHPRDFTAASLHDLVGRHPCPLRLADVRLNAWRTNMFFADHAPRILEYPLVAELVTSLAAPGAVVADIGAGVQPLVPYLTEHGYIVDTVDPSVTQRAFPVTPDCNEWGYLDYGRAGLARASYNATLDSLPEDCGYDIVMSVSVVEHLPGAVRRELLAEAVRRLRPGGAVVLTVDITPGTDQLWNRSEGAEVEPAGIHGDFNDFLGELRAVGLTVVGSEIVREWGDGPVDIGLVVARLG